MKYYSILGVSPQATSEAIAAAYQRERERYSAERVATMGDEFASIAHERLAALDEAYATLSDPAQRAAYDKQQPAPKPARERATLSPRELAMLIGGAVVGLALIVVVWTLAGRSTTPTISMAQLDKAAPEFELQNLVGETLRLSDYRGKVVLVNFWYTECAPCQEETPALQNAYQQFSPQGLEVIGVNVRTNELSGAAGEQAVQAFAQRYGVTYPIVYDENGAVGRSYQVLPLPSSFFIDPSGTIRYASYSSLTLEEVERVFNELQPKATAALK